MTSITMEAWIARRQRAMEKRGVDIPEDWDTWVALRRKSAFAKAENEKRAWMPLPNPEKLKAIWKKASLRRHFESEFKELYRLFLGEFERRYYDGEAPEDSPKVDRKLKVRGGGTVAKPWSPMIRLAEKIAALTDGQLEILVEDLATVRANLEELGAAFSEFDAESEDEEGDEEPPEGEEDPEDGSEEGDEEPEDGDPEDYDPEDDADDLDPEEDTDEESDGTEPELEDEDLDEGADDDGLEPELEGDEDEIPDSGEGPADEDGDEGEDDTIGSEYDRLVAAFGEIMANAFIAAADAFADSVAHSVENGMHGSVNFRGSESMGTYPGEGEGEGEEE